MKPSTCRIIALRRSRHEVISSLPATTTANPKIPNALALSSTTSVPMRAFSSALPDRVDTDDEEEDRDATKSAATTTSGHYFYTSRFAARKPTSITSKAMPSPVQQPASDNTMKLMNDATTNSTSNSSGMIQECTCGYQKQQDLLQENAEPLPPPLPPPKYSVHKRIMPPNLTALSSPLGRQYLLESMAALTAESYWALTEQFVNQSDPAYCGVTTLLMVLNAMNIDPNVRWKGGWRFYGDEDVLLQRCCLDTERIRRVGITMEQFMILGTCHGMRINMKRPPARAQAHDNPSSNNECSNNDNDDNTDETFSLEDFRKDLRETLDSQLNHENSMIVTSFSRAAIQQTGDGHFSPIAAYHEASDQVLILDVARFKYPPYWLSVEELYQSMQPLDEATQLPRGWYVMKPPSNKHVFHHSYQMTNEDRRPAHLVPLAHEKEACPLGEIKVQFCPASNTNKNIKVDQGTATVSAPKELQ